MGQLFETVRIEEGAPLHLRYHNARLNRSRKTLFGASRELDLSDFLMDRPAHGVWRCRVFYTLYIEKVEYLPYVPVRRRRFALAEFGGEYAFKYADRRSLELLLRSRPEADDLILVRDGMLTDTTTANIALRKKGEWLTPRHPLLPGTVRARLLEEGLLREADISCDELRGFEELALMNAMIGFRKIGRVEEAVLPFSERF